MSTDEPAAEAPLRRVGAAEAPAILRVIEAAFDPWPSFVIDVPVIDHLRWKMTPPPPFPADQHAVVELDGVIVAVQLRWMGNADVRGEPVPIDFGTDVAVHPSARGRGFASLMREQESERRIGRPSIGYDTVPQNAQVNQMYEHRGYLHRPLDLWMRTLTARAFLGVHRRGGPIHLARAAIASLSRRRPLPHNSSWRIEPVTAFDDRATALWELVRHGYELARVRDADWLNWRYLDPRAGRIHALAATEGDRLLGYVAVRTDGRRGRILDLVTDPAAVGVGATLLERATEDLRTAGCAFVECLLPRDHREETALTAAGFQRTGDVRLLQVTKTRHALVPAILDVMADPTSPIHVMAGDLDHG